MTSRDGTARDNTDLPEDELRAAVAARQELGPDYESQVVESFLERVQGAIDARVDAQVEARLGERAQSKESGGWGTQTTLTVISMGVAIPLAGIAGGIAGLPGLLIVFAGIVLINLAHAIRPRK